MDPQSEALRFRLRMTRGVSFPRKRESSLFIWILHQVQDDKECVIPAQAGIQSEWIPHQVQDDKECVIPAQAGIQSVISGSPIKLGMTGGDGSPIRSALLSVEDDKGAFGWG